MVSTTVGFRIDKCIELTKRNQLLDFFDILKAKHIYGIVEVHGVISNIVVNAGSLMPLFEWQIIVGFNVAKAPYFQCATSALLNLVF
jgi:hypothetical protein